MPETKSATTSAPATTLTETVKSSNKGLLVLLPLIMLLLGLGVGLGIGIFIGTRISSCSTNITPTPTVTPTQPVQNLTDFAGHYVTAKLPSGWTIVESTIFTGSTVSEGAYTGLASLRVLHNDADIVVLTAANGIGGTAECSFITRFADTSPDFIQSQIDTNHAFVSGKDPYMVDLTASTYTQYALLGNSMRRAGSTLYFKADASNTNFDVACGLDATVREFTGISFESTAGGTTQTYHSYVFSQSVPLTFTDARLLELDSVLQSIKPV